MSDNLVIPDAAVEAAVKAMYAQDGGVGEFNLWVYQDYAKAMLEAAAPHIQAKALDDAATELDDKRLLSKAFHIFYPEWLRERAAKLVSK